MSHFTLECLLFEKDSKKLYRYISQQMIENIDDSSQMKLTDKAFDLLNFKQVISKLEYSVNFVRTELLQKKYIHFEKGRKSGFV